MARLVVPGYPHHVTQRGNRRQQTFFSPADYRAYINLLSAARQRAGVAIWAYCLMPNHVHLVVVPQHANGLHLLFAEAHRRYTSHVNVREGWRGHLWQERFHSSVLDEEHLLAAVRYVELNPVRAGLCDDPEEWAWSSAGTHIRARDDQLVTVAPMLERIADWRAYLHQLPAQTAVEAIRKRTRTGRPAGDEGFILSLEQVVGRSLHRRRPGPVPGDK